MKSVAHKEEFTGQGAINASMVLPEGKTYELVSVSVKLSAAPSTSESLTITVDTDAGGIYDPLLYTEDLSVLGTYNLMYWPDGKVLLEGGDAIDVVYNNTDDALFGVQITAERREP